MSDSTTQDSRGHPRPPHVPGPSLSARPAFAPAPLTILLIAAMAAVGGPTDARAGEDTAGSPPEDWLSAAQQRIAEEEYQVTWQERTGLAEVDAAWQAPNRAHGFRTYFAEEGIRVVPRTEDEPSWEWGLTLVGYGRGDLVWPVSEAWLRPAENRIDYARGGIVEWYVNAPRGLEQGFTLLERPDDQDVGPAVTRAAPSGTPTALLSRGEPDRAVYVELGLTGNLSPTLSTDGQAIDFTTEHGVNVIHYSGLKVTDATGHELPAWMEVFSPGGAVGVRIVFDDSDAVYPVTIESLATSPSWTVGESDQIGAYLGWSVGTAGDVNGDGYADVIVGAYFENNPEPDEGRAYVYHGSASGLSIVAAWTAEGDQLDARFGISVGTAGDVNGDGYADVIVGASRYKTPPTDKAGRAFVYHGSAAGLSAVEAWTAEGDRALAGFGWSVGTAGDVNGDGYADVIVGANRWQISDGGAYVYHGSAAGLSAVAAWTARSDDDDDLFGYSVGTAGDVNGDGYADVIVGAPDYFSDEGREGRAFVYHGSAAGLSRVKAWTAEGDQSEADFGHSVGTAGDVNGDSYSDVIVGAFRYHHGALSPSEGRAFVYHGSAVGLRRVEAWTAEGDQENAEFGFSVGTAGDVNGDGYDDVIVGQRRFDVAEVDGGRALVYHGSPAGLRRVATWTAEPDQRVAYFGASVGTAGDVNGDGYADVIVGSPLWGSYSGRAYVYHSAGPVLPTIDITIAPNPLTIGGPLDILLDLDNPGAGFDARFRLFGVGNGPGTTLLVASSFVPSGFSLTGVSIFSLDSIPPGLPSMSGFFAVLYDAGTGELLASDFEAVGVGAELSAAELTALRQAAIEYLEQNGEDFGAESPRE